MKNGDDWREVSRALGAYGSLGLTMFVCIALGLGLGAFLDSRLGTGPWLLLAGIILGVGSAFKVFYDILIKKWGGKK